MQRNFGVTLDPAKEINHCIGSKTALAMLPAAFINPGRRHADDRARLSGGRHAHEVLRRLGPRAAAAAPRTTFCPTWTRFRPTCVQRAKLLVLCYPNSPTGKVATREFYERVIEFAQRNQIVVVQDAAHIMLSYGAAAELSCRCRGPRTWAWKSIRCPRAFT